MRRAARALGNVSRMAVLVAAVSFGGASLSLVAGGCGDEPGSTAGARVTLGTRVESGVDVSGKFVNARGWSLTLSKALVATSAFYYFDGAPPTLAHGPSPAVPRGLGRLFGIGLAHAHPGHYQAGNAMGQQLESTSYDLMQGPILLGPGEGVTGRYRSGSVLFGSPAQGPFASELGDRVLVLEGEASKGEETRLFRASASAEEVTNANGTVGVEGCVFAEADVEGTGTVVLRMNPAVWLDQVDFMDVPASTGGPEDLPAGGPAQQAFTLLGVTRASAYAFSFERAE